MSALLFPKHSVYQHGDHGTKTTGVSHCWKLRDLGESLIQKLQRSRGTRLAIQNSGCPKGCWISLIKHLEFILEDREKCKRWYPVSFPSGKLSVGHIERISPKLCCNLYNFDFKKVRFNSSTTVVLWSLSDWLLPLEFPFFHIIDYNFLRGRGKNYLFQLSNAETRTDGLPELCLFHECITIRSNRSFNRFYSTSAILKYCL